jgi:hypothetical protein
MTKSKYNPYGFDLLKCQGAVHRALTIAYAGNFTVQLIDTEDFEEIRRVHAKELTPALQELLPDIKFIDPWAAPVDMFPPASEFFNLRKATAEICVGLSQPTYDMLQRPGNVTQLLLSDIEALRGRHIVFDLPLNKASHEMLRLAYNRLRLKVSDAYLVQRIASVIACMDSSVTPTSVPAECTAEAINYQLSKYENG